MRIIRTIIEEDGNKVNESVTYEEPQHLVGFNREGKQVSKKYQAFIPYERASSSYVPATVLEENLPKNKESIEFHHI